MHLQVSEAVYRQLCDRYRFEERGQVEVKGIGWRRAYLLLGRSTIETA